MLAATLPQTSSKPLFNEAFEIIKQLSWTIYKRMPGMYFVTTREDFIQDYGLHFIEKEYLEKYDSSKAHLFYYILIGMTRKAIDMLRPSLRKSKSYVEVSESVQVDSSMVSIYELSSKPDQYDPLSYLVIEEAIDILSRHNGLGEKTFECSIFGEVYLCEYWVFKLILVGSDRKTIAKLMGVSSATIRNYLMRAQETLKESLFQGIN